MTEAIWLSTTEPYRMLEFLRAAGLATDRKLRLLICAVCRRVWANIPKETYREAVETAERYADALAYDSERDRAYHATRYQSRRRSHLAREPGGDILAIPGQSHKAKFEYGRELR